jgi:cyclase
MDFTAVNDYLIWTQEGRVNTVALDLGNKVIIIDAMRKKEHAVKWRNIVENHFDLPVKALVITHYHSDHTMGISVYKDVPVISSEDTKHLMVKTRKKYITETFTHDYSISGDTYTLHIVQTGGHTKGSSYGWVPESRLLIAGDTIFNKRFPFGTDPSVDPVLWQKALKEMITLEPVLIIPGHGPAATFEDLQEIHEFFDQAVSFIRLKLEEGLTPQQIAKDPHCPDYYSTGTQNREKVRIQSFITWAEKMKKFAQENG